MAFICLMLGLLETGYLLYAQTALDYAAKEAARAMQTGQVTPPSSEANFMSAVFCPYLTPFLSCSGVTVTLQPVTTFASALPAMPTGSITINGGAGGNLMMLVVYYNVPIPMWPLNVHTLTGSAAAYRNEF
jgi:Flp pilus assembly protein TadG